MDKELTGQVAFVTGASSGLGAHFARLLAAQGARVGIAARRRERLEDLVAEIQAAGGSAFAVSLDVTDIASIDPAIDQVEQALGPVDILINNSGVTVPNALHRISEGEYDQVLDTNLKGAFFVAQSVAKRLMARKAGGRIVNISSTLAHRVIGQLSIYCMSKIAMDQMTKAMALEWGKYDINTNSLCPGYIETEMNADYWETEAGKAFLSRFPRPRVGKPSDLDGMLLVLAGPSGRFVNGSVVSVDDGFAVGFK
ncbi:SDR family NAD(P)-dependent oxidoreductase [Minwuia sp. IMCC4030]|uniref:SDR family NAD(P)-dependent oxidoreductase n=1 Tax=Minwuia sp. IMCC4030 TaxID=3040677 RepID=UPI0024786A7D|nr:SDR family NAD(P)-dependent oxidoreductase [Minwuia sp. IMCC4030]